MKLKHRHKHNHVGRNTDTDKRYTERTIETDKERQGNRTTWKQRQRQRQKQAETNRDKHRQAETDSEDKQTNTNTQIMEAVCCRVPQPICPIPFQVDQTSPESSQKIGHIGHICLFSRFQAECRKTTKHSNNLQTGGGNQEKRRICPICPIFRLLWLPAVP